MFENSLRRFKTIRTTLLLNKSFVTISVPVANGLRSYSIPDLLNSALITGMLDTVVALNLFLSIT